MEEEMIGDTFALTQADLEPWKLKRVFGSEEVRALIRQMELTLILKERERLAAFEEGYDAAKEDLIVEAQDDAYNRGYEAGEYEGYRRGYFEGKKGYPSE